MPSLKVRRIDLSASNSRQQLNKLRSQFRIDANVVTAQSKKLTQAVFGESLSPMQAVERICTTVRDDGLKAVLDFTAKFDKVKLTPETIRVPQSELVEAHQNAKPDFLETIRRICYNIDSFQSGLLHRDAELRVAGSHELHLRYRPLRRVGVYCPGGAAAYPSTLLMTVRPAQVAGVKEIVVTMPPKENGAYNQDMLAVCHELGVTEVYRLGGAQAIAAMAYGVDGLPAVDMICGPGNQFVALAKKFVYGTVAIDCIAGPSEVVVAADDSAHPHYVALDLIAQAEHSPGVAVLVTWYEPLIDEVIEALEKRLSTIGRGDLARDCLEKYGAFVLAPINKPPSIASTSSHQNTCIFKPAIPMRSLNILMPERFSSGPFTPVALGDYAAGPSHVLPTGGTARFSSGLSVNDFRKRTSLLRFHRAGLRDIAPDVVLLANKEGLPAHALSVELRAADNGPSARPKPKPVKAADRAEAKAETKK